MGIHTLHHCNSSTDSAAATCLAMWQIWVCLQIAVKLHEIYTAPLDSVKMLSESCRESSPVAKVSQFPWIENQSEPVQRNMVADSHMD